MQNLGIRVEWQNQSMEMFIGFENINILEEKIAQIDDKVVYESKGNSISSQSRARLAKFGYEGIYY